MSEKRLVAFLESKGSLEILAEIGLEQHCRHIYLRERLHVSSSTLSNRLKEGVKLGVWEHTLVKNDDNTHKAYQLTGRGLKLFELIQEYDLSEKYREQRQLGLAINHYEGEVVDEVESGIVDEMPNT
ncbi:hypothetical protein ACLI4Z_19350 [Natrialbaceae archaeon A-arb3/5]